MKKIFFYLSTILIISICTYNLTIHYIPNIVYAVFHYKIEKNQNIKDNEIKHFDIPSDQSRNVVMPNPDFLYSTIFYDLSEKDLNINANMPDSTYWSVSFYKPNTINWFVKNDQEFVTNNLDLTLTFNDSGSENVIKSPVKKGFMIIRILVEKKDQKSIELYRTLQKNIVIN
ncbi:DUF1254 domain-containing protein [Flavobacteriaceae bacterium]|nr:DUF1254 domain-containing protein [Flavobacteriaceae bacterium]